MNHYIFICLDNQTRKEFFEKLFRKEITQLLDFINLNLPISVEGIKLVTPIDLKKKSRDREVIFPRLFFFYMIYKYVNKGLNAISIEIEWDRQAITHAHSTIKQEIELQTIVGKEFERIENMYQVANGITAVEERVFNQYTKKGKTE